MVTLATLYNDFKTLIKQNFYDKDEVDDALSDKQDSLVSGTNIKTVNNNSLLGSGNISISGSGTVDSSLSTTSTNPVQNQAITNEINSINNSITNINTYTTHLDNANYTVKYNDYRVLIDIHMSSTTFPTTLTAFNDNLIPSDCRPSQPVVVFLQNVNAIVSVRENSNGVYRKSITGSTIGSGACYCHIEYSRV